LVVAAHENHLGPLLKNFNKNMYLDYATKANALISSLGDDVSSEIVLVKSSDLAGHIAFRIKFDSPVFVMLSHPICRFRRQRNYPVREGSYIANMGLVPVYFVSLNSMTVLLLYGENTEGFFSPVNSPLSDTEAVSWELPPSSRPAVYSSMNFILQNGSDPSVADDYIASICKQYFDFGYWPVPAKGFVPSTHFLHTRKRITTTVKVTKSLYVVDEIGHVQSVQIEGHILQCRQVMLRALTEKDGQYFFAQHYALMDRELAEQIEAEGGLGKGFLNAMVSELQYTGGMRAEIMTLVADYINSYFELLQSLIGIVASRDYYRKKSVCSLGTLQELREKVFNAFLDIKRDVNLPHTVSDEVKNSFEIAVRSLFPLIVVDDNNNTFYTHPLLLGFIKQWHLFSADDNLNRERMIHLLRLLKCLASKKMMECFLSEDAEYFAKMGIQKMVFVKALMRTIKFIRMIKTIERSWITPGE